VVQSLRVIFFGTPTFASHILNYLIENHIDIVAIVTQPSRPQGRSSQLIDPEVKVTAQKLLPNVPIFQPEKASTEEFEKVLKSYEADLFIVVAYGELIKQNILDLPKLGCVNVHASLLPKYRGAAPIQRCLMAGERETGVSIMFMTLKMDAGDIIDTAKVEISPDITYGELSDKLALLACPLLLKVLHDFAKGTVKRVPQNHSLATFAPKITPQDTEIFWGKRAKMIHDQIRALSPHPGAWCWVQLGNEKKRFKIYHSHFKSEKNIFPPKTITSYTPDEWTISCQEDVLQLLEVQIEGKKKMTAQEFVRGHSKPIIL